MRAFGGPLDGTPFRRRPAGGWAWLDPQGRVSITPQPDRHPYRRTESDGVPIWLYAGHAYRLCEGCGALHEAAKRCELCGGRLVRM